MFNNRLVVIGVSTGGPITLREIFSGMPPLEAAVVIVLHIPPGMDRLIARGLDAVASMPVALAQHGEYLEAGRIYLAPGGYHLTFEGNRRIILREGERVNYVQPSADVAMKSLSRPLRGKIIGVVLTGMGKDGAAGLRHIKEIGGTTIAQDQKSSAIYGMPKAASQTGAVDFVFPPDRIRGKIVELVNGGM
ncbi:CheB methylesterase domain-containing protein [Geobacter sp.]|uniref:CheB methylesterase domain-containing protein n=1 Tax=Geobacter sp. TaxID=46610 RepID=UPI002630571E|nr:CheB methylesterase domain-containing protein [Geobacter sp.]